MKLTPILADMHVHSNYSTDAKDDIEEMIVTALNKGFKFIALTDHIDIDYPEIGYIFNFDHSEYKKELSLLKEKYSGKIDVLTGLEIGLQPHITDEVNEIIKVVNPDFVIGSTHCAFKEEISGNGLFKNRTMLESYDRYFDAIIENISCNDNFDSLGHLDFVERYFPSDDRILKYHKHKARIDKILDLIIIKEKALEINTSGFRYKLGKTHPSVDILERYRSLGGKLLTIGSDSHKKEDIGADFDQVFTMLKSLGFDSYFYYKKRAPVQIQI